MIVCGVEFMDGPFAGWNAEAMAAVDDGEQVRVVLFKLRTPPLASGQAREALLSFAPGIPGWAVMRAVFTAPPGRRWRAAMELALEWVVEATHRALESGDVPVDDGEHWREIVDAADEARADFHARTAELAEVSA